MSNYIYEVMFMDNEISVFKLEILKETPKQYKIISRLGYKETVNKSELDKALYYKVYSFDKDKAVEILKEYIRNKIKKCETKIDIYKKQLDLPVNEYTNE